MIHKRDTVLIETQIFFKGRLVEAILEDRKTQTRRIMEPFPVGLPSAAYCEPYNQSYDHFTFWDQFHRMINSQSGSLKGTCHWKSPYGHQGSHLWVRETWQNCDECGTLNFRATNYKAHCTNCDRTLSKWKPSIHMLRESSRVLLRVEGIRVQRLQDISEWEATAEGVEFDGTYWRGATHRKKGTPKVFNTAKEAFSDLWDSIYGKTNCNWESNPWIWAITFKRIKP